MSRAHPLQPRGQELNVFSHPAVVPSALGSSVGMDHFCFMVDASSIDDIIVDLRQAGIDIVKGPEKRRDGTAVFVHDPDGVRVELQIKRPTTQE